MNRLSHVAMVLQEDRIVTINLVDEVLALHYLRRVRLNVIRQSTLTILVDVFNVRARNSIASLITRLTIGLRRAISVIVVEVNSTVNRLTIRRDLDLVRLLGAFLEGEIFKNGNVEVLIMEDQLTTARSVTNAPKSKEARRSVNRKVERPLRSSITVPTITTKRALTRTVTRETTTARRILTKAATPCVTVTIIPTRKDVRLRLILRLVIVINDCRLTNVRAINATPRSSTEATARSAITNVINVNGSRRPIIVVRVATRTARVMTTLITRARISVKGRALIRALLRARIRRNLLLTIVGANCLERVALLVMHLSFISSTNERIFRNDLNVTHRGLLTVRRGLLRFLAVGLSNAVITGLDAQRTLRRLLGCQAFQYTMDDQVVSRNVLLRIRLLHRNDGRNALRRSNVYARGRVTRYRVLIVEGLSALCNDLMACAQRFRWVLTVNEDLSVGRTLLVTRDAQRVNAINLRWLGHCLFCKVLNVAINGRANGRTVLDGKYRNCGRRRRRRGESFRWL